MGISSEKSSSNSVVNVRSPLMPIYTSGGVGIGVVVGEKENESSGPTTPTSEGSRIPSKLPCPPPPRKRSGGARCNNKNKAVFNGKREFFITPPDLEAVFIRRHNNVGC